MAALILTFAASQASMPAHAAAARPRPIAETRGILVAAVCADTTCATSTLTVRTAAGLQRFLASASATVVYVGTQRATLSALGSFIGIGVVILSQPLDAQQVAGRIGVLLFQTRLTIVTPTREPGNR